MRPGLKEQAGGRAMVSPLADAAARERLDLCFRR